MSAAERARGARAEVKAVNYLRAEGWPDARRYLAGDGRQPGDIDFEPGICLEVKDVAKSAWPSWRVQAVAEAGGRIPIVLRRTRGVTDVGQWVCQVRSIDFRHMVDDGELACSRTRTFWLEVPFGEVVAELRRQREAS